MRVPIDRRHFLRASGVSVSLPLLESMHPVFAAEATVAHAPKRMVNICTTLGLHPPALWPKTTGKDYEATEYLQILQDHRSDFTLFSGLSHEGQIGRQPHNCEMTWLTAAQGPGLDGFHNTISLDQYAARELGHVTRFPSITLSSNTRQSQSFTSSGVMVPAETSPARLFARLFLRGNQYEVNRQKQRLRDGRSILDELIDQTHSLQRTASSADGKNLDAYLQAVRQAEQDIAQAQGWMEKPKPTVDEDPPSDIDDNANLIGRVRLLLQMIPLILQTDSSRVVSVMIQDHSAVPPIEGVSGEHHNLSHHGQDDAKISQLKKIETEIMGCFADLLTGLKANQENGATLLDNTSVLFGSNLGNANSHDSRNLPIILAGGNHNHGQYIANDTHRNTPLCNLFITMLHDLGLPAESFGQSSSSLTW